MHRLEGTGSFHGVDRAGPWRVCRLAIAAVFALSLAACERVLLENPPAAESGCDAQLVGRWLSIDDSADGDGEIDASVAPDCTLRIVERKRDGPRHWQPTRIATGADGRRRYLWVDAAWANRHIDELSGDDDDAGSVPSLDRPGDVYVYTYAMRRGRLRLQAPSPQVLAQAVLEGRVRGDLVRFEHSLTVRVHGDATRVRAALRTAGLFRKGEPLLFRRAAQERP